MKFGEEAASSRIADISFTGVLGDQEYQRIYVVGNNPDSGVDRFYISIIDPTHDDGEWPKDIAAAFQLGTGDTGFDADY